MNDEYPTSSSCNTNLNVTPEVLPILTPGGTREWIPTCSHELKPTLGMKFMSVDEGLGFYKSYAVASGFNTRKSTTTRRRKDDVVTF